MAKFVEVDVRGLSCPEPVLLTMDAMEEHPGEMIRVLGDAVPQFHFQRYRDSGNRIPRFRSEGTVSFIMNSYALRRKFITKEVTIYDQVS